MTEADATDTSGTGRRPHQWEGDLEGYHQIAPGKLVNTVTWLDMRAKPTVPLAVPLRLVVAGAADDDQVRALFAEVGTPWLWSRAYEDAVVPAGILLAQDDADQTVGLVELADRNGQVEIVHFGLIPASTGAGLGRRLMAAALEIAWRSAERVWLHTCNFDHPSALRFYLSCGFTAYATGFEIMDDPRLQGWLPEDSAPHVPLISRR